jgi:uncharacterized protein DUF3373
MKRFLITALTLIALLALAGNAMAAKSTEDRLKALEKKVRELTVSDAKDRIDWTGDLRVEAHSITGEIEDYYDGMALQNLMVSSMFMQGHPDFPSSGLNPMSAADIQAFAGGHMGEYMDFLNTFTFDQLKGAFGQMTPAQAAGFMQALMPATLTEGFKTDNDLMYTTRLRLNMFSKPAKNLKFTGRLSMYKPWGSATQTGMFSGQANTLNTDANWPGVPGDAKVKVDAAHFTWSHIADSPFYLSLGRRPSVAGPPLHYRNDEMRQGTPMGTVIDFQFDGATLGYSLREETTIRACYGVGYESQYGQGLISSEEALKDAQFFGFNIDAWNTEEMQVQTTIARAFDLTDGFNGEIIMPVNPVTGAAMPGPIVTRFSPAVNLGDFDLASFLISRIDGPMDWFVSASWSKSHPNGEFGPFGGLLSNPFEPTEEQTGSMFYLGARYNFSNEKTKLGLEWNKGSEYWFNFAPSQDDLISPKTSTRGQVIEGYVTHRVNRRLIMKLSYINYDYDYSGSGWHVGTPQDLSETALLGFPTYKKAGKVTLGLTARF